MWILKEHYSTQWDCWVGLGNNWLFSAPGEVRIALCWKGGERLRKMQTAPGPFGNNGDHNGPRGALSLPRRPASCLAEGRQSSQTLRKHLMSTQNIELLGFWLTCSDFLPEGTHWVSFLGGKINNDFLFRKVRSKYSQINEKMGKQATQLAFKSETWLRPHGDSEECWRTFQGREKFAWEPMMTLWEKNSWERQECFFPLWGLNKSFYSGDQFDWSRKQQSHSTACCPCFCDLKL